MNPIVCFDVGGTIVDDPFDGIVCSPKFQAALCEAIPFLSDPATCARFVELWQQSNRSYDFKFASHFAQEECWIQRALQCLTPDDATLPLLCAPILALYRSQLPAALASQANLPAIRHALAWLKRSGVDVHLASNDRKFATPAFVRWTNLDSLVGRVFVSEALSESVPNAEKPNAAFFHAWLGELGVAEIDFGRVAYVGDSERNDIEPAQQLGLVAVRYSSPQARVGASWLDPSITTKAKYRYDNPQQLKGTLADVLLDMGFSPSSSP